MRPVRDWDLFKASECLFVAKTTQCEGLTSNDKDIESFVLNGGPPEQMGP